MSAGERERVNLLSMLIQCERDHRKYIEIGPTNQRTHEPKGEAIGRTGRSEPAKPAQKQVSGLRNSY